MGRKGSGNKKRQKQLTAGSWPPRRPTCENYLNKKASVNFLIYKGVNNHMREKRAVGGGFEPPRSS